MFFTKLNVCSPPRSVRFGTESSQVHSITIFHRGSILLPQFYCKASLIIVSSGLFQRSTFSTRAWRQPCSWTSTWKRTRSSNWTKRLARIRASSRWLFLETESYFVFSSFPFDVCDKRHNILRRWTSRSWRTLWKIAWSSTLRCNTPGTRRRLISKFLNCQSFISFFKC